MSLNAVLIEENQNEPGAGRNQRSVESQTVTYTRVYGHPVRIPIYTVVEEVDIDYYETYCGPFSWAFGFLIAFICCPLAPCVACCPCDLRRRRDRVFVATDDR